VAKKKKRAKRKAAKKQPPQEQKPAAEITPEPQEEGGEAPPSVLDQIDGAPLANESHNINQDATVIPSSIDPSPPAPPAKKKKPGRRRGPSCKYCNRKMVIARTTPRADGGRVVYYECDNLDQGRPAWHNIPCGGRCTVMEDKAGKLLTERHTRQAFTERSAGKKIVDPRRRT